MIVTQMSKCKTSDAPEFVTFSRTNYGEMRCCFERCVNSSENLSIDDPNEIAELLVNCVKSSISQSTVTEKIKIRKTDKIRPWFNLKIYRAMKKKEKVARKWKKCRWNAHLKRLYKLASCKLRNLIKEEKKKFIARKANEKDPKKLWRNINEIMGRSKKCGVSSLKINGIITKDQHKIARAFNDFFIDSIQTLSDGLNESTTIPKFNR